MPDREDQVDLTDPNRFQHWTSISLRYSDQDAMGHVNNTAYAAYVAEGRTSYVYGLMRRVPMPGIDFVLRSIRIDYRTEVLYPGTLDIGTRVLCIGTSSMTLGHALFKEGTAVTTGESVVVFIDLETRKATPIPDGVRRAAEVDLAAVGD